MTDRLKIALGQINPVVGDLKNNTDKIISFIRKAGKSGADLVVFPELALCGYPPEDLLLKEHFITKNIEMLNAVIKKSHNITVVVGFVDRDKANNLYNAAAVIGNDRLKGVYRKILLPNYGVFDEKRYFTPGKENPIFSLGNINFGVSICEDIWGAEGPWKVQAEAGANLLINISASPYHAGKIRERERLLRKRAQEARAFICYVNLVGGQDELVFDGTSFVFDPDGGLIVTGRQFEEDLVVSKLQKAKPGKRTFKAVKQTEEIYKALVLGTKDYIRKNGFKKVVIGLSGGVDSSLTTVIACDAIGKENVVGISMPSQYSSGETQRDAKKLAENTGIKFLEFPIHDIFDVYMDGLSGPFAGLKEDITEENLQARIRGNLLMAFSNKFGWLVLTTGNKSEVSVGYCTLYGDTAGGFAVIKDVPKTLVYKLARFRNSREKNALIPESVLRREPSAELRPEQKDRDTLPDYEYLDAILKGYVEEDKSLEEIIKAGFNRKIVKSVIKKVDSNEYKRRQSAPGLKITPKAFGRDRRLPITNQYGE